MTYEKIGQRANIKLVYVILAVIWIISLVSGFLN